MGKRGPAPKPTALRKLQGNPGKRPYNKREPKPSLDKPRCPIWLSDVAKREWKRLVNHLNDAGILTYVDRDILALYCESLATWIYAEQKVRETSHIAKTAKGNLIQNPWLTTANRAKTDCLRFMRELGLTPSSRSRIVVGVTDGDEEDLASALFRMAGLDDE